MAVKKILEGGIHCSNFPLTPNDGNLRKMKMKKQVTYFLEVYQSK
jgi:hypothetical protein